MKTDSLLSKFYVLLEGFVRLALINILWIIFNLPTVFIAISLLISQTKTEWLVFGMLLIISIPLFLFPATMAMFATVRILVRKEHARIIRDFWGSYKENFGRSFLSGIVFALIWIVLLVDFIYFGTQVHVVFKYIFSAIFLYLFMFTMHYFSIQVHFDTGFLQGFKNALLLTLKNPFISIAIAFVHISIVILSYKITPILLFFITGSIITTISFIVFYKISLKNIQV